MYHMYEPGPNKVSAFAFAENMLLHLCKPGEMSTHSLHQIAFAALSCQQARAIMKPDSSSLVRSVLPTDCRDPVSLWRFANWCCQYLTRWSCPTNTSCATPVFMAIVFSNKIGQHNDIRLWLAFEYADRTVADDWYSLHTPAEPVRAADDLLLLGLEV